MVSFLDHEVHALIDPRATHSFISYQLAHQLQLQYENMSSDLCLRTPLGENVIVKQECRNCMLKIREVELSVNLVVMPLQDFDLILRMYWLSEH